MYYDINKTLSHNCLLNFVVGPRGVGKTYSFKRRVIKNFLSKGEQFVYLRRYKTEIEAGQIDKFWDDICIEFADHKLGVDAGRFFIDGKTAGYALPLSKASQYKSVPFPAVSMIGFDEFIIDQGMIRYLPNEVHTFNEMYSTIARLRDVKAFFLSNAITFTNPYFLFYDIKLQQGQKVYKNGDILVEVVDNPEYMEKAANTRFGKIIANTEYGRYAINNEFLRDSETFIEKIPGPGIALFNISAETYKFTVYSIMGINNWYISENNDPSCKRNISLDVESHSIDTTLKGDRASILWIEELKQKYFRAEVRFTTMKAKNLLTPYFKKG